MSLAASMTRFTRTGADLGGIAFPWRSFALWPLTVRPESDVPVPPLVAMAAGAARARVVTQASDRATARRERRIRNRFEDMNRSPSSACGVSCRAGAKGACAPAQVGRVSPGSGSPAPRRRTARTRLHVLFESRRLANEISDRNGHRCQHHEPLHAESRLLASSGAVEVRGTAGASI